MELNFKPEIVDAFYAKWIKLGWCATGEPFPDFVDPEKLIVETTHICRHDGRLFKAMLTWIRDYHDLINIQKILHLIDDADRPVLGAAVEIAIQHGGAGHRLKTIVRYCQPYKPAQVLFKEADDFGYYDKNQREFGKNEYRKWGLFCTMIEFYDDAMHERHYVLKNNPLLAIRALIGPNIRSEILFQLEQHTKMTLKALKENLGYAYSAIYNEVMNMVRNGFLINETNGKNQIITMNKSVVLYLKRIPV